MTANIAETRRVEDSPNVQWIRHVQQRLELPDNDIATQPLWAAFNSVMALFLVFLSSLSQSNKRIRYWDLQCRIFNSLNTGLIITIYFSRQRELIYITKKQQ